LAKYGFEVPEDYAKAMELGLKAYELGSPDGAYLVSVLYGEGYGVERDAAKAAEWNEKYETLKAEKNQ